MSEKKWVQTWGQSHSALSFFKYPSAQKTYRLVVSTAISGEKLRLSISNTYGKNDVVIGAVTAAKCDENGVATGEFVPVTFCNKVGFTLKKGQRLRSDEASLDLKAGEYFCLSIYVKYGDLTSGNLIDSANLITIEGNWTYTAKAENHPRTRDSVIKVAEKIAGMHLPKPIPLFDSVELLNSDGAESIVVFGDSISQQGLWTGPFEERIREAYPGKYSLINKSVMGNRLLRDCSPIFPARGLYGKKATTRICDDIYPYENIKYVIFFMGVNDIFEYASINALPSEKPDTTALCETIKKITEDLQSRGMKVVMFNIPAFGSAPDATHEKDELRKIVNAWLEENQNIFDGYFDIASAAVDPDNDYVSKAEFIGPDKLHPNAYGGRYLSSLIDLEMFK